MEIIRNILTHPQLPHPVVSLGNFDGVHLGHQAILQRLVAEAKGRAGTALVLTFHPHPLSVLRPDQPVALLLNLREKMTQLAALGVDRVLLQRFSLSFSHLNPEEFVERYLVQAIGAEKVIIGHNFSFGRDRSGRSAGLADLGKKFGFAVETVGPIMSSGHEVSSTAIRSLLRAGKMSAVAQLLGRSYAVSGRVEKGFKRGRTIGFPTANLRPRANTLLPNGVYAVRVDIGEQEQLPGVANVGINPTFGGNARTIETHIFDFSADLYGQHLRVSFIEHLRGEKKFPSVQDLVQQIQTDAARARALFSI